MIGTHTLALSLRLDTDMTEWVDDVSKWAEVCVNAAIIYRGPVALCRLWLHLHILHKHSGYVHCRRAEVIQKSRFVRTVSRSTCADCACGHSLVYHACM